MSERKREKGKGERVRENINTTAVSIPLPCDPVACDEVDEEPSESRDGERRSRET